MAKAEAGELSFIDRMDIELHQLDERITKLQEFIQEEVFKTLPAIEQQLLYIQVSTMSTYGATLSTRIDIARNKEASNEEA